MGTHFVSQRRTIVRPLSLLNAYIHAMANTTADDSVPPAAAAAAPEPEPKAEREEPEAAATPVATAEPPAAAAAPPAAEEPEPGRLRDEERPPMPGGHLPPRQVRVIKDPNPVTVPFLKALWPRQGFGKNMAGHYSPVMLLRHTFWTGFIAFGIVACAPQLMLGMLSLPVVAFTAGLTLWVGAKSIKPIKATFKNWQANLGKNFGRALTGQPWRDNLSGVDGQQQGAPSMEWPKGPGRGPTVTPQSPYAPQPTTGTPTTPLPPVPTRGPVGRTYQLADPQSNYYLQKLNAAYASSDVGQVRAIVDKVAHQPVSADSSQATALRSVVQELDSKTNMHDVREAIDRALAPLDKRARDMGPSEANVKSERSPLQFGFPGRGRGGQRQGPQQGRDQGGITDAERFGLGQAGAYDGVSAGGIGVTSGGPGAGELGV